MLKSSIFSVKKHYDQRHVTRKKALIKITLLWPEKACGVLTLVCPEYVLATVQRGTEWAKAMCENNGRSRLIDAENEQNISYQV